MRHPIFYATLLAIAMLFLSQQSHAIPAFARSNRLSCNTCHAPAAPALKPYGDEFAGNGFKIDGETPPRYFTETGDSRLSLLSDFPLALRLDGFITYNMDGSEKTDLGSPYLLKLLSGGALSDKLSYYFYFYLSERGKVAGVEDAFLMYNDLFGIDLDIYLGQFQISDPLFKRELRLSLEDYVLYTSKIGTSNINLKYDRGIMLTLGLETGTSFALEVVNGNGLAEARNKVFDDDNYKNVLGRISQDLGSMLGIGAFIYSGKEILDHETLTGTINQALIWGPDITFAPSDRWQLNAQYLHRNDTKIHPDMTSTTLMENVGTDAAMAELIFSPQGDLSNWYLLALYNWVESDFSAANYQSATLHAGYLLRRNVRLAAEYTLDFTNTNHTISKINFGFVSAF